MNPLEAVRSFLGHLDRIIDRHPVLVAMGVLNLFILLGVLFVVYVVRHRAKGLIKPGPPIIFIESSTPPPPPPEPVFDPFPLWRQCDCEHDQDD
jgi:hypothetical protein